jgi:hypothetical protein
MSEQRQLPVISMTDYPVDMPVPQFALDDAAGVANLLEQLYFRNMGGT